MISVSDLIVGAKAVKMSHNARKQGESIEIIPVKAVPVITSGYWAWTPEACLAFPKTPKGTREAVKAVFQSFDENTQHKLTLSIDSLTDRVRFWQQHLKPALTPEQYSTAILTIIKWYRETAQYRLGIGPQSVSVWD